MGYRTDSKPERTDIERICGAIGCDSTDGIQTVTVDGTTRTLCGRHIKDFLGVSS